VPTPGTPGSFITSQL